VEYEPEMKIEQSKLENLIATIFISRLIMKFGG